MWTKTDLPTALKETFGHQVVSSDFENLPPASRGSNIPDFDEVAILDNGMAIGIVSDSIWYSEETGGEQWAEVWIYKP